MMELWNSLGCKMCRKPLEACESVNKTNTRKPGRRNSDTKQCVQQTVKFEGTFRQQLQQGARAEDIDPQPVAARCGHIFHRGCIKKLTTELNSSCIECPICVKPIVLMHVWPIEFYHPEKDGKSPRSLSSKVHSMNDRNNSLQDEIVQVRRLKQHRDAECREVVEAISAVKESMSLRRQELDDKLVDLFGTATLDERYEENVRFEKETILERVKDLTNRNSQLLSSIEERAKTHYVTEGDNAKELPNPNPNLVNNSEKNTGSQGPGASETGTSLKPKPKPKPKPTATLLKRHQSQVTEPNNHTQDTFQAIRILNKTESGSGSGAVKMSQGQGDGSRRNGNGHGNGLQRSDPFTAKNFPLHLQPQPKECECDDDGRVVKSSVVFDPGSATTISTSSIHPRQRQRLIPVPVASVTKSMQDLFEREKLRYLQEKSKQETPIYQNNNLKTSRIEHHPPKNTNTNSNNNTNTINNNQNFRPHLAHAQAHAQSSGSGVIFSVTDSTSENMSSSDPDADDSADLRRRAHYLQQHHDQVIA